MEGNWTWDGPAVVVGAQRYELAASEASIRWANDLLDTLDAIKGLEGRQLIVDELEDGLRVARALRQGFTRLAGLAAAMDALFSPSGLVKAVADGGLLGMLAREAAGKLV